MAEQALVERQRAITELVGTEITSTQAYAERIRALQGQAHILSPMSTVGYIAPNHVINPMIVVIDPSVDIETGRGADVYFQKSIHKYRKTEQGDLALEVSLNKNALVRILRSFNVDVHPPQRTLPERYWWIVSHEGDLLQFDGSVVRLPAGTASVDLRDGSADIDEWTPEAWKEAVRIANEQRARVPEHERWKVKARIRLDDGSYSGWTRDRVMQQRKFGLELAETKSLNRLARNLGIKQSYTVAELAKPFVIFRASFVPPPDNPRVQEMLALRAMGARHLLFPDAARHEVTYSPGDPSGTIPGEVVDDEPTSPTDAPTAAPPSDVEEASFDDPKPDRPATTTFLITRVSKRGKGPDMQFFVEATRHDGTAVTFYTVDTSIAKACKLAMDDKQAREITSERIQVSGQPYQQIIEFTSVGGLKL